MNPQQILINEYTNNTGIRSHFEDVEAFGPVIVTISLLDPIWITLKRPLHHSNSCPSILDYTRILLPPRSCFIMQDDARYDWRHAITKAKVIPLDDKGSTRTRDSTYRRVSLTIRKLLETRKTSSHQDDLWVAKEGKDAWATECDCE
jgi:alkylated DNA repair dioxygenase AlkB